MLDSLQLPFTQSFHLIESWFSFMIMILFIRVCASLLKTEFKAVQLLIVMAFVWDSSPSSILWAACCFLVCICLPNTLLSLLVVYSSWCIWWPKVKSIAANLLSRWRLSLFWTDLFMLLWVCFARFESFLSLVHHHLCSLRLQRTELRFSSLLWESSVICCWDVCSRCPSLRPFLWISSTLCHPFSIGSCSFCCWHVGG